MVGIDHEVWANIALSVQNKYKSASVIFRSSSFETRDSRSPCFTTIFYSIHLKLSFLHYISNRALNMQLQLIYF